MRVVVYVEGESDQVAMEALLAPLIAEKYQQGIEIRFVSVKGSENQRGGDAKKDLLLKIPVKAVNMIGNDPNTISGVSVEMSYKWIAGVWSQVVDGQRTRNRVSFINLRAICSHFHRNPVSEPPREVSPYQLFLTTPDRRADNLRPYCGRSRTTAIAKIHGITAWVFYNTLQLSSSILQFAQKLSPILTEFFLHL